MFPSICQLPEVPFPPSFSHQDLLLPPLMSFAHPVLPALLPCHTPQHHWDRTLKNDNFPFFPLSTKTNTPVL